MTASLYPTPSRLDLLRAVAAGEVYEHHDRPLPYVVRRFADGEAVVTDKIRQMHRAGWVASGAGGMGRFRMEVTAAGAAVLVAGASS